MTTATALNLLNSMTVDEIKVALDLDFDVNLTDLVHDEIYQLALACLLDSDNF
jgi:hypothetical protein